jgi:hypothetical protein
MKLEVGLPSVIGVVWVRHAVRQQASADFVEVRRGVDGLSDARRVPDLAVGQLEGVVTLDFSDSQNVGIE